MKINFNGLDINLTTEDCKGIGRALSNLVADLPITNPVFYSSSGEVARGLARFAVDFDRGKGALDQYLQDKSMTTLTLTSGGEVKDKDTLRNLARSLLNAIAAQIDGTKKELTSFLEGFITEPIMRGGPDCNLTEIVRETQPLIERIFFEYRRIFQ